MIIELRLRDLPLSESLGEDVVNGLEPFGDPAMVDVLEPNRDPLHRGHRRERPVAGGVDGAAPGGELGLEGARVGVRCESGDAAAGEEFLVGAPDAEGQAGKAGGAEATMMVAGSSATPMLGRYEIKKELAKTYAVDRAAYQNAKSVFIQSVMQRARSAVI